jgi:hypothetical protein
MKRLRIDRIELHLRNVSPATAKDAAHRLGPELARAFASSVGRLKAAPTESNVAVPAESNVEAAFRRPEQDAGHLTIGAALDAHALATGIAERIAATTSKG